MIRTLYRPKFSFSFVTNLRRKIEESDPEIYKEIINEKQRQIDGVNLIAS